MHGDLQEADRRAIQHRATGLESCSQMNFQQLRAVLSELDAIASRKRGRRDSVPYTPTGRKLAALWREAYRVGAVQDSSHEALAAFIRRQTGLDAARFATHDEAGRQCIEPLKAMIRRGPPRPAS